MVTGVSLVFLVSTFYVLIFLFSFSCSLSLPRSWLVLCYVLFPFTCFLFASLMKGCLVLIFGRRLGIESMRAGV